MADTIGVTTPHPPGTPARPGADPKKRKKILLVAGAAGGALLLLGHKNANAATAATDPNAQLQNQADALAAANAANDTAATNAWGGAPVDSGGGNITGPGSGSPSVTVNVPPLATPGSKPGQKKPPKKKPPAHHRKTTTTHHKAPHPKEPPKGKPAPAHKSGKHPHTRRKTPSGTKKRSPAVVESVRGIGAGQMVMGREFPGALGHRMGPPQRAGDGTVSRTVTLDYGGRTETHRVYGNGDRWRDREPGANPPGRGLPVMNNGGPV